MLTLSRCARVRFQPYAMAVQTRFKWRHKETDRWRRLMDATCFQLDWFGQTRGPNFSQYSGHWTHIVTCAHVICPWDYPNFYPPTGPTRFVSHITLADTMTQIRLPSLQGQAVYKHFVSNQHVYVHSNPRLDLCVLHPEQNLRRSGEMKMLWLQNEGYLTRPRLELVRPLQVGDVVWIYGMNAQESLFDEEKAPEPRMIPVGLRARVHTLTREHFFIDTRGMQATLAGSEARRNSTEKKKEEEEETEEAVVMGMCGSVIMREGRCVGMLTATVHRNSACTALAGTVMCTYAHDIFEFLLEVEKQMKNALAPLQHEETVSQKRRQQWPQRDRDEDSSSPPPTPSTRVGNAQNKQEQDEKEEGSTQHNRRGRCPTSDTSSHPNPTDTSAEHRDWELDNSRVARHIPVPVSLWHMEQKWVTEEDYMTQAVFGRSGVFNQETQESALHLDMNSAKSTGERPSEMPMYSTATENGKVVGVGERKDHGPRGIYTSNASFRTGDEVWESRMQDEVSALFNQSMGEKDVHTVDALRRSLERIRTQRATETMTETMTTRRPGMHDDPLNVGAAMGHFGARPDAGAANFVDHPPPTHDDREAGDAVGGGSRNDFMPTIRESRCGYREATRSYMADGGCATANAKKDTVAGEPGSTDAYVSSVHCSSSSSSECNAASTLRRVHAESIARKKRERREAEARAKVDRERRPKGETDLLSQEAMHSLWRSHGH